MAFLCCLMLPFVPSGLPPFEPTNFTKYQLVNTLPFLGKITEKAVLRQFNGCIENKLPNYISAYKEGCSTEMVLLDVNDNILMNMDKE